MELFNSVLRIESMSTPTRISGNVGLARLLRSAPTEEERLLWSRIRERQLAGFRFRRQCPLGPFIVDFCCLKSRLIIELDGGQHYEMKVEDRLRTLALQELGFRVLRFWNTEVFKNMDGVLSAVLNELKKNAGVAPSAPSGHLPNGGGIQAGVWMRRSAVWRASLTQSGMPTPR